MKINDLSLLKVGKLQNRILVELKNIGSSVVKPKDTPRYTLEDFSPNFISNRIELDLGLEGKGHNRMFLACIETHAPLIHADDCLYEISGVGFDFDKNSNPDGLIFVTIKVIEDGAETLNDTDWPMAHEVGEGGTFIVPVTEDDISLTELLS